MTTPSTERANDTMIPTRTSEFADVESQLDALFPPAATGKVVAVFGIDPYWKQEGGYEHRQWKERPFDYPAERDKLIQLIDLAVQSKKSDAYLCTGLSYNGSREEGSLQAIYNLHSDWDGDPNDEPECLDAVRALNGFAFSTGTPGHLDCFLPLAEPIITSGRYDELAQAFHAKLPPGSEKYKWNDVLRIVGTDNLKDTVRPGGSGQPTRLHWKIRPSGQRWDLDKLALALGVGIAAQEPPQATNGSGPTVGTAQGVPFDLIDYPDVVAALTNPKLKADGVTVDRSATIAAVVGACASTNLELKHVRWAVMQRADLADKLAGMKSRDDVQHCWLKAIDSRQKARRDRGGSTAGTFFGPNTDDGGGGTQDNGTSKSERPRLWNVGELRKAEQPKWLAKNRIPQAAVTILIGEEGIGKSLLWVLFVAAITNGTPMECFGIPEREPADIHLILTEDEWSSAVLPRLQVAGADLNRVKVICTEDDGSGSPVFPDDMSLILNADPAPALVVCDAWLDTVPVKLRVGDTQQSRQALHPWKEAAGSTGASMLLLAHSNRLETSNIRDKYGATAALRQKARATLYCLALDDGTLIVGPDKSNGAPGRTRASKFRIKGIPHFEPTLDHDGTVPLLEFIGESDKTIREHLAEAVEAERRTCKPPPPAVVWLREFLTPGQRTARTDINEAGEKKGFSKDQIARAREFINKGGEAAITVEKDKAEKGKWYWTLQQTESGEEHDDPLFDLDGTDIKERTP